MDMDDSSRTFRITFGKAIFILSFVTLVGLSISLYLYSRRIAPEEGEVSEQFNRLSASMRHTFKVNHLTHKAYDAILMAIIEQDERQVVSAKNYMEASLGFINVQYIQSDPLVEQVAPVIKEAIVLIDQHGISMEESALEEVRSGFAKIDRELNENEKNINIEVQKLYSRQQIIQNRWKTFYIFIIITSALGLLIIIILALQQRKLIGSLKRNEQKLKAQSKERIEAEREKVRLTEQLHQAQKMESIGLMAGSVAHDLNNILAGIVGYPALILSSLPEDSKIRKPLEAIQDSGERAALVVADLLTIARGVATARSNQDVNKIIAEYFKSPEFDKLASTYPHVSYRLKLKPGKLWIRCSPVHVKKCIMNLVTNGFEAIIGAGTITVETDVVGNSSIFIKEKNVGSTNEFVIVKISDTGPGISQQDIDCIFDPFYSKKKIGRSGSGLGLTIVWNTMEDHGGKVDVENTGNGTCFSLYYPASEAEERTEEQILEILDKKNCTEDILVVDDEEQLRDLAKWMLKDAGFNVVTVSSGEEAILFLQNKNVDLIVLDMIMNTGINGYEAFKQILEIHPNQKALIVSGYSESEDVKNAMQIGASGFMNKPYTGKQLIKKVHQILYDEKDAFP